MKKKLSKKVKVGLIVTGAVVSIAIVVAAGLAVKNSANNSSSKTADLNSEVVYEVTGEEPLKFKGNSIISKEQNIVVDKTQGEVKDLKVEDKQDVKAGDVLFTYHSTQATNEKEKLNSQINSNSEKSQRSKKNKDALNNELNSLTKKIETEKSNSPAGEPSQAVMGLTQKNEEIKAKIEGEQTSINAYNDVINELTAQRDLLSKQEKKNITAEIDGIAYIYEKGLSDITSPYIRIVSKEPLIKGEASEFEIESIKVGDKAMVKVVSTDEMIKGIVTSIDELPAASMDGKSLSYTFNIKQEKPIRIGFNVEIKLNYDGLTIPKECVIEEDSKLYVAKSKETSFEKVEIKGVLDGENYTLENDTIKIGDKISKTPIESLKVEVK